MANEVVLNTIMIKASLLAQAMSSMQRFVLPLLSKVGQSSGLTKSNSLSEVENELSKFEKITEQ